MSELTLDFTDASFDADPRALHHRPIGQSRFRDDGRWHCRRYKPLLDRGTGENVADDEFTGARAISSMAISSAPGTTFDFEFIDNPDDEGSASGRASAPWVTNMRRAAMLTVTTLPFHERGYVPARDRHHKR